MLILNILSNLSERAWFQRSTKFAKMKDLIGAGPENSPKAELPATWNTLNGFTEQLETNMVEGEQGAISEFCGDVCVQNGSRFTLIMFV